jgi:DNA-binding transcriptional MerR regulator
MITYNGMSIEEMRALLEKWDRTANNRGIPFSEVAVGLNAIRPLLDALEAAQRRRAEIWEEAAKVAEREGHSPKASTAYCAAAFHIAICIRALASNELDRGEEE